MKDSLVRIFKENYKNNEINLQSTLVVLKNAGFTQVEIVKLLINEFSISLKEADEILVKSKAWENEKNNILKLREDFGEELSK